MVILIIISNFVAVVTVTVVTKKARKGKEANEIDIVGILADGKKSVVAEVKRQRRNYDHRLFLEKVERIKATILSKYEIKMCLLTLEDM